MRQPNVLRLRPLRSRLTRATLILCLCALPSVAHAQTRSAPSAVADRNQFVSFDDDLLDGNLNAPSGGSLWGAHLPPARTLLIRPRTNFIPELYKSVENI